MSTQICGENVAQAPVLADCAIDLVTRTGYAPCDWPGVSITEVIDVEESTFIGPCALVHGVSRGWTGGLIRLVRHQKDGAVCFLSTCGCSSWQGLGALKFAQELNAKAAKPLSEWRPDRWMGSIAASIRDKTAILDQAGFSVNFETHHQIGVTRQRLCKTQRRPRWTGRPR